MNLRLKLKSGAFAPFAEDASCVRLCNHFLSSLSVFYFAQQAAGARFALLDFSNDFLSNHSTLKVINFKTQMKQPLLIIFIFISLFLQSQVRYPNRAGITLAGLRAFREVLTEDYSTYGLYYPVGLSYLRSFKKFNLRAASNFYRRIEEVPGRGVVCYDCLYGSGTIKALEFRTGIQKEFTRKITGNFIGLDIAYMNSTFKGSYQGGLWGGGYHADQRNSRYGISPNAGFEITPIKHLVLCFEYGLYFGVRVSRDSISNRTNTFDEILFNPSVSAYWGF
jgi:hypothetical protein